MKQLLNLLHSISAKNMELYPLCYLVLFCDLAKQQKIYLQLFKKRGIILRAVKIPLQNKHRTNAVESRLKMKTTKQLNRTTDKTGASLANHFYNSNRQPLTAAQTTDLTEYVHKMATGHAYNRYYLGSLKEPPQPDYIDDLTQTALLALFDGQTVRNKKLTGGQKTVITTLESCKTTTDKTTGTKKRLTNLQAFRRFIAVTFNDYNYNERATTATVGKRQLIPLELTADNNTDELFYITDMLDFAKWTENELNNLHALTLTADDLQLLYDCIKAQSKEKQRYLHYIANSPLSRESATGIFNTECRRRGKKIIRGYNVQRDCIRYIRAGLKTGQHSQILIDLVNTFTKY